MCVAEVEERSEQPTDSEPEGQCLRALHVETHPSSGKEVENEEAGNEQNTASEESDLSSKIPLAEEHGLQKALPEELPSAPVIPVIIKRACNETLGRERKEVRKGVFDDETGVHRTAHDSGRPLSPAERDCASEECPENEQEDHAHVNLARECMVPCCQEAEDCNSEERDGCEFREQGDAQYDTEDVPVTFRSPLPAAQEQPEGKEGEKIRESVVVDSA